MPLEFIHTNKIADLHTHTHMYAQIEQKVSSTSIICLISLRKCESHTIVCCERDDAYARCTRYLLKNKREQNKLTSSSSASL